MTIFEDIYIVGVAIICSTVPLVYLIWSFYSYYKKYRDAIQKDRAKLPERPGIELINTVCLILFLSFAWPFLLPILFGFGICIALGFIFEKIRDFFSIYIERKATKTVSSAMLLTSRHEHIRKLGEKER